MLARLQDLAPALPAGGDLAPGTDWGAVGLVLSIVGSFLLANAILFRHPRTLVADHFGERRPRLGSIRDTIFHRVNIYLGFLFLLGGFVLQLFGHVQPQPLAPLPFPTPWVGAIVVGALALEVAGFWLSRRLFRNYVRAYLTENPFRLAADPAYVREVGALFDVPTSPDDTVQSYLVRVQQHLEIPFTGELMVESSGAQGASARSAASEERPRIPVPVPREADEVDEDDELELEFDDESVAAW